MRPSAVVTSHRLRRITSIENRWTSRTRWRSSDALKRRGREQPASGFDRIAAFHSRSPPISLRGRWLRELPIWLIALGLVTECVLVEGKSP